MAVLSELELLVIDCQATAAGPRGHLLEIGWARVGAEPVDPHTRLIKLPDEERLPPAVARITGISDGMLRAGIDAQAAGRELCDEAAAFAQQPAPAVAHFARFERQFLPRLAEGAIPIDLVCTHEISRRVLPDLPRRSLRALAGYFGRAVGPLRRSGDHVVATAFVWRSLVPLLAAEGIATWTTLREWLAVPLEARKRRRVWPMPRSSRLALPDLPGVYRLLRTSGDVLYVGKAASLHHRVNSHFRKQAGLPERTLEMLSQARALSYDVVQTALEAALLETDEIKRHQPPYNVALAAPDRRVWFTRADFSDRSSRPSAACHVGPFAWPGMLDRFVALNAGSPAAVGDAGWAPDLVTFQEGYSRLCAAHGELSRGDLQPHERLLRLGTRLWGEGRRDHAGERDEDDETGAWTPERVQRSLEWLALRTALARRRARWVTHLVEATVVWREPVATIARLIVVEHGHVTVQETVDPLVPPPVPPGHERPAALRHETFTIAQLDRLRVLTTELKRLVAAGAPVALRFGDARPLAGARLARALSWL